MLTVGVLLLCLGTVIAQFPRDCTTTEALQNKNCCPLFKGSPCGATFGRGTCQIVPQSRAKPTDRVLADDRMNWPTFYYNTTCRCYGNYDGANCGYCKGSWNGSDCSTRLDIQRREFRQYTEVERTEFIAKLNYCKALPCPEYVILTAGDRRYRDTFQFRDASYYDIFVHAHYYASKPIMGVNVGYTFAYGSSGFLTWRRRALHFFEHLMRICTGDDMFVSPYIDWRSDSDCFFCNDENMGDSNSQGVLSQFSVFSSWGVS
ncbi:tyrosinase-like [Pelobates cultripes]|uniref:Tyrosinase-like n=1 Tax=Pelobates cultripes TaxID=61616 RepID=A0AAD1VS04_PELCU|nr:tyrosinase-like [Pelobates cultripes]